ncbi:MULTISPECIES: hypothetical protein [unclassified Rhodococcus (in: high G+C Gram-positive bacteria)]|uniref:hypothetical protein n=1 Tax=unclassified Rhodococcus (in: high G+C Gram-positive bacteria) TaxID=192944 RepID=UPI0016398AA6|nr:MULTISPECIES: hypothetical protein [unclassified Rhodococcus (in: high G+C Gram-positive bacteria)]MBC2638099.1 hypothetical protein [Rhodococcus sp. 3A]MBC2897155.1 hypothetical protein [Rhodococcus sp. 4CII]
MDEKLRNLGAVVHLPTTGVYALTPVGSFEAIDALARALPLQVVADLIGVTGSDPDASAFEPGAPTPSAAPRS